ncbi:MAG: hypothetical protein FJW96_13550 [Actinobacteria bacterium]|nr:hypothetical protein [Actinomycetota bacterium]
MHEIGREVRARLADVFAAAGIRAQVLGEGPLFQVVVADHPIRNYDDLLRADNATAERLARVVVENGIYTTGRKGYLSLVHTDGDIDCIVAAYAQAAITVAAATPE